MPLQRLDHYFVYANNLEQTRAFYAKVLDLENGPRPDFGFDGYWFYLDGAPVVHVGDEGFEGGYVENPDEHVIDGPTGPVDHIAFRGNGIDDFVERFDRMDVTYQRREIPDFKLSQLFVKDPNGVTIELNFFHEDG